MCAQGVRPPSVQFHAGDEHSDIVRGWGIFDDRPSGESWMILPEDENSVGLS